MQPPSAEGGSLRAQSLLRQSGEPAVLNGSIIRVNPDTGAAMPDNPLAASADPNAQRIVAEGLRNPFRFTFWPGTSQLWIGASGSSDADPGDTLTYAWDFGDGATAAGVRATHTYAQDGQYTAQVKVTDSKGASDTATMPIDVGATGPVPHILAPVSSTRHSASTSRGSSATSASTTGR